MRYHRLRISLWSQRLTGIPVARERYRLSPHSETPRYAFARAGVLRACSELANAFVRTFIGPCDSRKLKPALRFDFHTATQGSRHVAAIALASELSDTCWLDGTIETARRR
jgi:hypothetical protein